MKARLHLMLSFAWPAALALFLAAPGSAATITGTVRNEAGTALANVDLDFIELCSGDNIFLTGDKSAADGTFSVVVPNGTYDVHFTPPTGSVVCAADFQDVVVSANQSLGIVTLHPGTLVSGTVRTPALAAAAGVDLKFVDTATQHRVYLTKDVTNAAGQYSVRVPQGTYDVDYRPGTGSTFGDTERRGLVVGAADVSGLSDVLKSGFTITGTVRDKHNNKLKNVDIDVYDACTGERVPTAHDNTDVNGNYSVVVPAGTYTFDFNPPRCIAVETGRSTGLIVDRAKNFGTEQLKDAVLVSGTVLGVGGVPRAEVKVKFYDVTTPGAPRQPATNDRTDAAGHFSVYVPPGTYDLDFEPDTGVLEQVAHLNNVGVAFATNVGSVSLLAGVPVSGHVTGNGGLPVLNVNINAVDAVTRVSQRIAHDDTDANGNFTVVMAPGVYDIEYDPPACTGLAPSSQPAVVIAGATALATAPLVTGVHAQGSVLDPGALPVANVDLDFYVAGTATKIYTPGDKTAADGTYNVLIPPGAYDVKYIPSSLTRFRPAEFPGVSFASTLTLPTVSLANGFLVSGFARDSLTLAPVADVTVEFYPVGSNVPAWTPHHLTGLLGDYNVSVDAGTYDLRYVPPVGSPLAPYWRMGVVVGADTPLPDALMHLPALGVAPGALAQASLSAWPNPSRGPLEIAFTAPDRDASVSLWDVAGRHVRSLWSGRHAGEVHLRWDGTTDRGERAPAGLYYVRLSSEGRVSTRRVVLVH